MLADLVNSMRGFLQKSPANINKNIATRHVFLQSINTSHLLNLKASEAEEQIRNDTIAKRLA